MDTKDEAKNLEHLAYPHGTQVWFTNIGPCQRISQLREQLNNQAKPAETSDSPNDPLNWPAWRRDILLFTAGFNSFLCAALCPILATGFPAISESFGVSNQQVSFTIGIYMLGLGVGAAVWSPTAALFGRRPVYVAGSVLLIASSAWAAASPSYASLIIARLVQGIASSPGEFLVSVTISEIYQPHERGFRLGVYMLLLAAGKSLAPLIGAGVIQGLGWRWALWLTTILSGISFSFIFVFARETYWARGARDDISTATYRTPGEIYTDNLSISPPLPFKHTMALWNGRFQDATWFSLAIKPFRLVTSLPLLWSAAVYALSLGWLAVLADTVSYLFQSVDGYGFTPMQTGLLYISPLIGTILGSVVGGKVSDILACMKASRNKGIYEAESRLVMILPATIATVIALGGYGWSIEARAHWIVPTVCFGFIYFGCILGSTIAVTYCLDCHKSAAIEAQVILSLLKNSHGLAFSLFVVDWVKASGPRDTFLEIAGIHLAFLFMTVPLYVYGKRVRVWMTRGC